MSSRSGRGDSASSARFCASARGDSSLCLGQDGVSGTGRALPPMQGRAVPHPSGSLAPPDAAAPSDRADRADWAALVIPAVRRTSGPSGRSGRASARENGDATGRGESSGSSGANEPAGPAKPAEAGKSDESGEADGPRRRSSASSRARVAASSSRTVFTTFSCPRNRQRNMKARPANSTMTNANSMFFPFRFGALSRRVNPRRRPHKAARPILSRTGRPRPGAYRFPP